MNNNNSVDIRPSLGDILNGYQRESYRPETAIAEFVDNSTASYYQNKKEIDRLYPDYILTISIRYDSLRKTLFVDDNAWGMDLETFKDALTIAKKPKFQGGRNEYGMGLKKAASWFGKCWSVDTKGYGENYRYSSTIDIDDLLINKANEVHVETSSCSPEDHFTRIKISKLCRNITPSSIEKLKIDLSSIYRSDLKSGKIEIYVNGEKLSYEEPKILEETIDGVKVVWKKEIEDSILFDNQEYKFYGYVALREEGKYKETGFALLRRGRVIIGGLDKNYKPRNIFKNANDFVSLRLFGELHLDDFPVTQAKDNFDWDLNGLEEIFQKKLEDICEDYIKQAKNYRVKKDKEATHIDAKQAKEIGDETISDLSKINTELVTVEHNIEIETKTVSEENEISSYTMHVRIMEYLYNIMVSFNNNENAKLIDVDVIDKNINITFNTNFPYFDSVNRDINFIKVIQKYLILFVVSEIISERTYADNDGKIKPTVIRETLNSILEEIVEKSKLGEDILYE